VILPEAVVEVETYVVLVVVELSVVLVVVESSFLAHDPRSTTMPTIKTIQNSNFFMVTSLGLSKL
jgi:hypothetical protein